MNLEIEWNYSARTIFSYTIQKGTPCAACRFGGNIIIHVDDYMATKGGMPGLFN